MGGLLTALAWQAAFLVFVPIIALVLAFGIRILPSGGPVSSGGMDVWGTRPAPTGAARRSELAPEGQVRIRREG